MLNEQMTPEMLADTLALERLTKDPELWGAIQRLFRRTNDDLISKWSADEEKKISRQYVKGGRDVLAMLHENIERSAALSVEYKETEKEARNSLRSIAEDGMGSGDLAI